MQLYTHDLNYNGKHVTIHNHRLQNFFSCSYLGLELHEKLIEGSCNAAIKYGTQFSASRGYISCGLYEELEDLFVRIFDAFPVISASTTLGHINNIPILIGDYDCVIYDWQVHASVQTALDQVRIRGVKTFFIRHNDMEQLADLLSLHAKKYKKIWYCCDGVYSMFGEVAPTESLYYLMQQYDNFYLYVDDAHGMSIEGKYGRGFFLNKMTLNERIVLVTSLAKAFGVTGGVTLVKNVQLQDLIRTCGKSLIFSGPLTPPVLGACVASAKLHLSDEIKEKQYELKKLIKFTNHLLKQYQLPIFFNSNTPICFVGIGTKKLGYNVMRRLYKDGKLVNIAIFPAVSEKNTGIRFTINLHQQKEDLVDFISSLSHHLALAMVEEGYTKEQLTNDFSNYKLLIKNHE